MPKYSSASKKKLLLAHPDLQIIFNEVIKYYDNTIVYTFRNEELQNNLYEQGLTKKKYPHSKHNIYYSMAVDSAPYIDGTVSQDMYQCYHYAGFVKGIAQMLLNEGKISHKLIGGSDWDNDNNVNDQKFRDLWHFELSKIEGGK